VAATRILSDFRCSSEERQRIRLEPKLVNLHAQCVDTNGIGVPELVRGDILDAVDIWGWVRGNPEVCFARYGSLVFLDASYSPRRLMPVVSYLKNGWVCAGVERAGTFVLQPPLATPTPQPLAACRVITQAILNIRAAPVTGAVLAVVMPDVQFLASGKQNGYYRVNYWGLEGWISGNYVVTAGDC